MLEQSVHQRRRRRRGRRSALADEAEDAAADPVAAALVADHVAPPADAVGLSGGVARPGHRAGARQDENPGAAGERAEMCGVDIIENEVGDRPRQGAGDRLALRRGDLVHLAIGGKRGSNADEIGVAEATDAAGSAARPASSRLSIGLTPLAARSANDSPGPVGHGDERLCCRRRRCRGSRRRSPLAAASTIVASTPCFCELPAPVERQSWHPSITRLRRQRRHAVGGHRSEFRGVRRAGSAAPSAISMHLLKLASALSTL